MFRQILVPVDHHPSCVHAAQYAHDLARTLGGQVTLLWMLRRECPQERQRAARALDALAAGARRPPRRLVVSMENVGVHEVVATVAAEQGADLIVLRVGDEALEEDAFGTLATRLTWSTGIPVQLTGSPRCRRSSVPGGWQRVLRPA